MKIVYLYNGKEYLTEREVRQALWNQEYKVFAKEPSEGRVEFWSTFGVQYSEVEVPVSELVEREPFVESEEVIAARVREKRNGLLYETDRYFLLDAPITEEQREVLRVYRQALRDIPQQEGFPYEVEFPEKPEV